MRQSTENILVRWGWILKLLIAAVAFTFIYWQVVRREGLATLVAVARDSWSEPHNRVLLSAVLLGMLINWAIEAFKWKRVLRPLEQVSLLKALEAVFSGLSVSFFTPNRVGEYAGRVFHLVKADRPQAVLATILENVSQLVITLFFGGFALAYGVQDLITTQSYLMSSFRILSVVGACFLVLAFIYSGVLQALFVRLRFSGRWLRVTGILERYTKAQMIELLLLSALRYFIFTGQFFLLLHVFGAPLPYGVAMLRIALTYLAMSVIPSIALTELGVRGALAAWVFQPVTEQVSGVLLATSALWVINLVLPALIGLLFVFDFKFVKKRT